MEGKQMRGHSLVTKKFSYKSDQNVLRWFKHIVRVSREHFTERAYACEVEERIYRGRLCMKRS